MLRRRQLVHHPEEEQGEEDAEVDQDRQIRLHLAESAGPVVGDDIYGRRGDDSDLGLRAVRLAFADPFTRRRVAIRAPVEVFYRRFGFKMPAK